MVVGLAPLLFNQPNQQINLKKWCSRLGRIARNNKTTLNNGYLGSRNDEERSEMRYVV
jgi:hypothetical protein